MSNSNTNVPQGKMIRETARYGSASDPVQTSPIQVPRSEQLHRDLEQLTNRGEQLISQLEQIASKLGVGRLQAVTDEKRPTRAGIIGRSLDLADALNRQFDECADILQAIQTEI